jgi:hypothetical protein
MSRPLRLDHAGAVWHVTSRGNERREIFGHDEDRERFLAIEVSPVRSAVDVASMPQPDNRDNESLVLNLVDNPVVAGSEAVKLVSAGKRFDTRRPWMIDETADVSGGFALFGLWKALKLLEGRWEELDTVSLQRPSRFLIFSQEILSDSSRSLFFASSRSIRSSISSMNLRSSTGTSATTSLPRRFRMIRSLP